MTLSGKHYNAGFLGGLIAGACVWSLHPIWAFVPVLIFGSLSGCIDYWEARRHMGTGMEGRDG